MQAELLPMTVDHWTRVREIYQAGIAGGQATFETNAPEWEQWDTAHLKLARIVAVVGGEVKGWGALSRVSRRDAYAGVAEVSVYVAPESQGMGLGRLLLQALIHESEAAGVWTLQATIFPENKASTELHLSCGFRKVGYRERISRLSGVWRNTILVERRSTVVGLE